MSKVTEFFGTSKINIVKIFKMIKVELKVSWRSLLVSSIGITILALIPIMIASDINVDKGSDAVLVATITLISPTITQIYMYTVILRLRGVLRDKSTLDKNRAAFLTNKKSTVVFSKVFLDVISFILPMILTMCFGMWMVISKNGELNTDYIQKLVVLLFGITFVYIGTSLGMRYIDTLAINKMKKAIILGLWVLLTLGVTIVGAIVVGILGHSKKEGLDSPAIIDNWLKSNGLSQYAGWQDSPIVIPDAINHHGISHYDMTHYFSIIEGHAKKTKEIVDASLGSSKEALMMHKGAVEFADPHYHIGYRISNIYLVGQDIFKDSAMNIQNFFTDNQILVSVMPILNFITPFLPFYKLMDAWTVIPLMAEIFVFVIVIWRPLTRRLKTHLTT